MHSPVLDVRNSMPHNTWSPPSRISRYAVSGVNLVTATKGKGRMEVGIMIALALLLPALNIY